VHCGDNFYCLPIEVLDDYDDYIASSADRIIVFCTANTRISFPGPENTKLN
jgi:hypothetical protein